MGLEVRVAIYNPIWGNYQHWALFIDDGPQSIIFEVSGEHPDFRREVILGQPEDIPLRDFRESLFIGDIGNDELAAAADVISKVAVDNETVGWDCQDYVLESLDALIDAGILDDSLHCLYVRDDLMARRGPM